MRARTRLHIRIAKPEHPLFKSLILDAYPRVKNADPSHPGFGKLLKGERKELKRTFRPVKKNGETVAWNVFFRVNEPDRDYYIDFYPDWNRVPGTHSSYGDAEYAFHVRIR